MLQFLALDGLLDGNLKVQEFILGVHIYFLSLSHTFQIRPMTLPDRAIDHG